jgi:Flp pilus assembly protein TadG
VTRSRLGRAERGQSTVEVALVLPILVVLLLAIVQVAVIARDYVVVVHAARAAVREASVDAGTARVRAAATHALPGAKVEIGPRGAVGAPISVTVRYTVHTDVPLVGALFPDRSLHSTAVMRLER